MINTQDITNLFNINYLNKSNISLSKALLIFYVVIASNFTDGLVGKQLREYIQENRMAQHLIAFIMMFVLIHMIGGIDDMVRVFAYSAIGYLWFIFTTKLDAQWNIIVLALMFMGFIYESDLHKHEVDALEDKVLSQEEKERVINNNSKIKTYIVFGVIGVTIVGTMLYAQRKQEQYGGGFNPMRFLFY